MKPIILASTSKYRAQLLKKTGLLFRCEKPLFDEEVAKKELLNHQAPALEIAEKLSKGKAHSISEKLTCTVIAGDQLVHLENKIMGKSHNFEKAFRQLQTLRGREHQLITAVTILSAGQEWHLNHLTHLKMRNLSDTEIKNYLEKDQPYDCAGSYKIENHGIILFEEIKTDDFTAIQGLPLIWISKILTELGYEFFKN